MANLTEEATWEDGIRRFELTDAAIGGEGGVMNLAINQLANRTLWLKEGRGVGVEAGTSANGPTAAATEDDRSRLVVVQGGTGEPDTVWIAVKLANDAYSWLQIA